MLNHPRQSAITTNIEEPDMKESTDGTCAPANWRAKPIREEKKEAIENISRGINRLKEQLKTEQLFLKMLDKNPTVEAFINSQRGTL
jgi:hypothetical protein